MSITRIVNSLSLVSAYVRNREEQYGEKLKVKSVVCLGKTTQAVYVDQFGKQTSKVFWFDNVGKPHVDDLNIIIQKAS